MTSSRHQKQRKIEIMYRAHYLRKGASTCKYGTGLCHTCNFITCNTFHDSLKQHVMKSDKKKIASIYETNSSRLACIHNNQQCDILLVFSRYHYHNHGHRSKYSLFSSECFLQTTQ